MNATPKSYFFADPMTFSQDEWAVFGPRGDNNDEKANQFSLSSIFGAWGSQPTTAYAICKGVVFIQPQNGSGQTKVNLVLRPLEQPFPGLKIRYFVYRGLQKVDFFNDNEVLAPTATSSDLINKMNASFASFYTGSGQPVPDFLAKYIGFDPTNQNENLLIDDFFFKQSTYSATGNTQQEDTTTSFELPMVQGGDSLGRFAPSDTFGMDIILDYGDFKDTSDDTKFVFDLSYMRAWRAELNFWDVNDPSQKFVKKQLQEQVLQFVDIMAFYGAHVTNGKVMAKIDGTWYGKTGADIYNDLLDISPNKNRWYFYIQSDRTRSYNFYGNYDISPDNSNCLKKGYTEATLAESGYNSYGWPIMIDDGSQSHSENVNNLFLQFTKTPNNANAMLYVPVGNIVNAQHNNFCDAENLSLPDDADGTPVEWTRPLQFNVPAIGDAGSKQNIASFTMMLYQGRDYAFQTGTEPDENNDDVPVYTIPNYIDEIFDGLAATPLLKPLQNPLYTTVSNQRLKLISNYYNRTNYGIAAVQTTRITDVIATDSTTEPLLKRVTYVAESVDTLNNAIAVGGKLNTGAALSSSAFSSATDNDTYQLPQPFYYERQLFTDSTTTITGLRLKTTNDEVPDRVIVGLTEVEHNALKALITGSYRNARLFFIDLFEDGNELISAEGITYQKYRLGIVVEEWDGNLKLLTPNEDVMVYAIDRYYYYTEGYSRYVMEFIQNENSYSLIKM